MRKLKIKIENSYRDYVNFAIYLGDEKMACGIRKRWYKNSDDILVEQSDDEIVKELREDYSFLIDDEKTIIDN